MSRIKDEWDLGEKRRRQESLYKHIVLETSFYPLEKRNELHARVSRDCADFHSMFCASVIIHAVSRISSSVGVSVQVYRDLNTQSGK